MRQRTRDLLVSGHRLQIASSEHDMYLRDLNDEVDDDVLHLLNRFLPDDAVVVDVGANIGLMSLAVSRLAPRGHVLAFEPVPSTSRYLAANIENNAASNVTCHAVAVGAERGTLTMIENTAFLAGSSVVDHASDSFTSQFPADGDADDGEPSAALVQVPATTLDLVFPESGFDRLDVVKSDTEGFDLDVLRGAAKTLEAYHPIVIVEFSTFALTAHRQILPGDVLAEFRTTFDRLFVVERWGFVREIVTDRDALNLLYTNASTEPVVDLVGVFHDSRLAGAVAGLTATTAPPPVPRTAAVAERPAPSDTEHDAAPTVEDLAAEIEAMKRTLSWRITRPLRAASRLLRSR